MCLVSTDDGRSSGWRSKTPTLENIQKPVSPGDRPVTPSGRSKTPVTMAPLCDEHDSKAAMHTRSQSTDLPHGGTQSGRGFSEERSHSVDDQYSLPGPSSHFRGPPHSSYFNRSMSGESYNSAYDRNYGNLGNWKAGYINRSMDYPDENDEFKYEDHQKGMHAYGQDQRKTPTNDFNTRNFVPASFYTGAPSRNAYHTSQSFDSGHYDLHESPAHYNPRLGPVQYNPRSSNFDVHVSPSHYNPRVGTVSVQGARSVESMHNQSASSLHTTPNLTPSNSLKPSSSDSYHLRAQLSDTGQPTPPYSSPAHRVEYEEWSVFLQRQETGFGFRIIGGTEEGSQVKGRRASGRIKARETCLKKSDM